jgi:hypothetical protein
MLLFTDVNQDASKNPFMLYTDSWRLSAALALAGIRECASSLIERRVVPEVMEEVNDLLMDAEDDMYEMADLWEVGVENLDPNLLNRAAKKMSSASNRLEKANDLMEEIMDR